MQNRLAYLDVLRLLSVVLVIFGHYVMVGGGATEIPGIISDSFPLPLYDQTNWQLWKFEIFMIEKFSTQASILGVTLFFIVTGYLMPMMLDRYTRRNFLVNRFFRIFPVLFVATIVLGTFVGATQGIIFSIPSYIASWTLTYLLVGVVPIAGVLWTLVIEVLFYAFAIILGKFSMHKLFLLQVVLLVLILVSVQNVDAYYLALAATQSKYLLTICLGSAIFLAEKEDNWLHKFALVFGSFVLAYLGFQVYRIGHKEISTYNNLGTYISALTLFLIFYSLSKFNFLNRLPKAISWFAVLVYPIYLLHAGIGLGVMALMRNTTTEPYSLLVAAISSTLFISWLLHKYIEKPGIAVGRSLVRRFEFTKGDS